MSEREILVIVGVGLAGNLSALTAAADQSHRAIPLVWALTGEPIRAGDLMPGERIEYDVATGRAWRERELHRLVLANAHDAPPLAEPARFLVRADRREPDWKRRDYRRPRRKRK